MQISYTDKVPFLYPMRDNANLSVIQPTVHINISIGKVSGEIEKLEISKDSLELADYKAQIS